MLSVAKIKDVGPLASPGANIKLSLYDEATQVRWALHGCRDDRSVYIRADRNKPTNHLERKCLMTIAVGDKLPDVKLTKATADGPEAVQSSDYFKGKRVALFSVPGAFTPTCSAKHLPGYVEKAADLKAKGIDEIACTAVNDPFVMGAWNQRDGSPDVTMLADGNGEFAQALGLTMDGSGFGMGQRGSRWSAVINDGVVEQLNVEAPGDFSVSSAEAMYMAL